MRPTPTALRGYRVSLAEVNDGSCVTLAKACSKTCSVDADCVAVGPQFKCFATCSGGKGACGQTRSTHTAEPFSTTSRARGWC